MDIRISNIKKSFGEKTAVNIPDFLIESGEILGLVGNNGAGKTTLFRIILDLLKADEGEVVINNDVESINPAKSEKWKSFTGAYIDEGFLIDFLTPEEYFEFIGKINNMTKEQVTEELEKYKSLMGGEILGQKKYIRSFSAGNKQKIGIISTLINNPKVIILDEPFNFLDPTSQNHLKRVIEDYNKRTNATIVISSHNLQHTIDISTRIALLENVEIIRNINNVNKEAYSELENYFNIQS